MGTVAQWLGRATALGIGDFYTGKLARLTGRVSWKPSATFSLTLSGTRNSGRLPQSDFLRELVGARVEVNASPDLQLNAFVQYDNESGTVDAHTRLRWTFDPRGDVFLVHNHNLCDLGDRWLKESNQFLIKVQYAMRVRYVPQVVRRSLLRQDRRAFSE